MSEKNAMASQLYETVKNLSQDLKSTDRAKAILIIEYAQDAIAAYENTNQEKKVELKELIRTTQEIIPPKTFQDLKTIVQSKLLKFIYPKNPKLRNMLFILVALTIIVPGLLALKSMFPTAFSFNTRRVTNELETLPSDELEKLEPEGGGGGYVWVGYAGSPDRVVSYTVYNGSNYELKEITVHIVCVNHFYGGIGGAVLFDKNVSLPLDPESTGAPFTNSKFSRENVFPLEMKDFKVQGKGVVSAKGIWVTNTAP